MLSNERGILQMSRIAALKVSYHWPTPDPELMVQQETVQISIVRIHVGGNAWAQIFSLADTKKAPDFDNQRLRSVGWPSVWVLEPARDEAKNQSDDQDCLHTECIRCYEETKSQEVKKSVLIQRSADLDG